MFRPHDFKNRVLVTRPIPKVLVTPEAYKDMATITKLVSTEVGWVGTVRRVDDDLLIERIFLLPQNVSATTTEISAEGMAELAIQLLSEHEDGEDIVNSIRFWGHSHVNMGTSPSGQDNTQMEIFEESCDDFFIRGIVNKKGRMEFKVYLYEEAMEIEDAEWGIYYDETNDWEREMELKAEIAEKVKPIVYERTPYKRNYEPGNGSRNFSKDRIDKDDPLQKGEALDDDDDDNIWNQVGGYGGYGGTYNNHRRNQYSTGWDD